MSDASATPVQTPSPPHPPFPPLPLFFQLPTPAIRLGTVISYYGIAWENIGSRTKCGVLSIVGYMIFESNAGSDRTWYVLLWPHESGETPKVTPMIDKRSCGRKRVIPGTFATCTSRTSRTSHQPHTVGGICQQAQKATYVS